MYKIKKIVDKVVELVGGGSVINGAYPVYFLRDKARFNMESPPSFPLKPNIRSTTI